MSNRGPGSQLQKRSNCTQDIAKRAFDGLVIYGFTGVQTDFWPQEMRDAKSLPNNHGRSRIKLKKIYQIRRPITDSSTPDSCVITHKRIRHALWLSFYFNQRTSRLPYPLTPQTLPLAIISCFQN